MQRAIRLQACRTPGIHPATAFHGLDRPCPDVQAAAGNPYTRRKS